MAKGLRQVRFNINAANQGELASATVMRGAAASLPKVATQSDEGAARAFLALRLQNDERADMRGVAAADQPGLVKDLECKGVNELPRIDTRLVRFEQTKDKVPIFGARISVELDAKRNLISIDGDLADVPDVPSVPTLSEQDALAKLDQAVGQQVKIAAPTTVSKIFIERGGKWHLAYFFEHVPAAPKDFLEKAQKRHTNSRGHGAPRSRFIDMNYFVDAHDGTILDCYSAVPMVSKVSGFDEFEVDREFFVQKNATGFALEDSVRALVTYDLQFAEAGQLPTEPASSLDGKWDHRGLVSAHANATWVMKFLEGVLSRNGIDDKGMRLVSAVNCVSEADEPPPEWHNAAWWRNCMWYGQVQEKGRLVSCARYLDIIAHEITHGITEYTAGLVYQGESGALNESFSDIFGVLIANWFPQQKTFDKFTFTIGDNFSGDGKPLRDFSNPNSTGDPDHMKDYLKTPYDNGGVHTNSNIHNKAAHNVMMSRDAANRFLFTPEDAAILYYLTLSRLTPTSGFSRTLTALLDVTRTYFAADAAKQAAAVAAITTAYANVGITP